MVKQLWFYILITGAFNDDFQAMNQDNLQTVGLYIHFPWCENKCPFCDFNAHPIKDQLDFEHFGKRLLQDLQTDLKKIDYVFEIDSIFLGGGSPSLWPPKWINNLLTKIRSIAPIASSAEITLEANPTTFETKRFSDYYHIGINRLSIGIQSFSDKHLARIGRKYGAFEAHQAIEVAIQSGFKNINLDLMFALPDQSIDQAINDLKLALDYPIQHISWYELTIEAGSTFYQLPPKGLPEHQKLFEMTQEGLKYLSQSDCQRYEVSAFAKTDYECRHNLHYWHFDDYLGIGPGAAGKITQEKQIIRTTKASNPTQYLNAPENKIEHVIQGDSNILFEIMLNTLRVKRGLTRTCFEHHMKCLTWDDLKALSLRHRWEKLNWITLDERTLCPTEKGLLWLNSLLENVLNDEALSSKTP